MAKNQNSETVFDDLYRHVASFGVYQIILFFGSCSLILQVSSCYSLLVFAMGTPNFHCETAYSTNMTCGPSQCCSNCTEYVFDGPFTSIVNEWNLLCDKAYQQAIVRSCFYVGDIIGSISFGIMSDKYGRKKILFTGTAIMVFFVFGSSFADCLSLMGFLWFCAGLGVSGVIVSEYVYFMEIVGPRHRTFATCMYEIHWSIGSIGSVVLAYFIRDWRMLTMASSIPAMALLFTWKFFPETPRWLVAHGHLDESFSVLQKCGSKDKNKPTDPQHLKSMLQDIRTNQVQQEKDDKTYTILDLMKSPKIRKWTLAVSFQWFVITNISHGMMLYVTNLSGNIYVNFLIMRSIAIFTYLSFYLIVRRFGRRAPHAFTLMITAVLCLIAALLPKEYGSAKAALFIAASCISTGLWLTTNLFASEIFPTVLRNNALGLCSMSGRIGGLLAPYVDLLANLPSIDTSVPVIIFAILCICGAVVTYWIPETINANMHQTIEEVEAAQESYDIFCCKKPSKLAQEVQLESSEGEKMLDAKEI